MQVEVGELLEHITAALHKPVYVEGADDRESLEKLGFTDVRTCTEPTYRLVEECEADEILILTDLDSAGKRLYSKLQSAFTRHGITIDNDLRHVLFRTDLHEIEGLYNFVRRNIAPHRLRRHLPLTI